MTEQHTDQHTDQHSGPHTGRDAGSGTALTRMAITATLHCLTGCAIGAVGIALAN